ncbi:MAG: nucleotidyltransferase family protein [Mesorhizobium sp.]
MSSTTVTTLSVRKTAEAARRKRGADAAIGELARYAREHGGRFIVFGSYVTDAMRFDSDLVLPVDFPKDRSGNAWRFAEEVCRRLGVPVDLRDASTITPAFVARVLARGLVPS